MKTQQQLRIEAIRLAILQVLSVAPSFEASQFLLWQAIPHFGSRASTDSVMTELCWLEEQGMINLDHIDQVWLARVTDRGRDIAIGRARVPGVQAPAPSQLRALLPPPEKS